MTSEPGAAVPSIRPDGILSRIAGVIRRPRVTLAAVASLPGWMGMLVVLTMATAGSRVAVMAQVLTESITLSTFGGIIGILLGFLAASGISALTPLPARLEPWSVVLGVGITAAVGLFFGAYPASRAASLDPIEALRRE